MPAANYFLAENFKRTEIDEFLTRELKRAEYSKVELTKTPLGTRVVIYAARPGMVIGKRGESIRGLTKILAEKFKVENPQISVAPIEEPELDAKIVAAQISTTLERGVRFRQAAYWALKRVMGAGALGVEIKIQGKLTTERSRAEKYTDGYLPKAGNPVLKQVRAAVTSTHLKQGLFGVQVKILPPNIEFVDRPTLKEAKPPSKVEPEKAEAPLKPEEAEAPPAEPVEEEAQVATAEKT